MANEEQLAILRQGVEVWNKWRRENSERESQDRWPSKFSGIKPDLRNANLCNTNLSGANLSWVDLSGADLRKTNLIKVNLQRANLTEADLTEANLDSANLRRANLSRAILSRADLWKADLGGADLRGANLNRAYVSKANLRVANLQGANLSRIDLSGADISLANLSGSDLTEAKLSEAYLKEANLSKANLSGASLRGTSLVQTVVNGVKISGCSVYGISVWDLKGEFEEQKDLVITPPLAPIITVDNIKVAQFIYLILNNEVIRDVINTLTSKSVLILGRFGLPERKAILDALRNKLREYDLLPIVFDFDRPTDKDFTETIKTLASLSYFVIADVTNPKSSPLELQATVPDYQIPFVPIIQEGEQPFAMMVDLQKKYNWVLQTRSYDSIKTLMKMLKPLIIDPAMEKHNELRLIKAQEPEVISGKDFLDQEKDKSHKEI
jgi:uncharacterized protein YjbI with pentapeptide repeats